MPFPFQQSNLPLWKLDCKNCLLEWNNFQPGIQTDFGGEFHNPEVKQNLESKEMKLFPPSMEKLRLQLLNIAEEFEFETMQIFYGPQYIYIVLQMFWISWLIHITILIIAAQQRRQVVSTNLIMRKFGRACISVCGNVQSAKKLKQLTMLDSLLIATFSKKIIRFDGLKRFFASEIDCKKNETLIISRIWNKNLFKDLFMKKNYKGLRKVVTHSLLKMFSVRVHVVVKRNILFVGLVIHHRTTAGWILYDSLHFRSGGRCGKQQ